MNSQTFSRKENFKNVISSYLVQLLIDEATKVTCVDECNLIFRTIAKFITRAVFDLILKKSSVCHLRSGFLVKTTKFDKIKNKVRYILQGRRKFKQT